jgi:galactoside O-acetyltransferase
MTLCGYSIFKTIFIKIYGELQAYLESFIFHLPGSSGNSLRFLWCLSKMKNFGKGSGVGVKAKFLAPDHMYFGNKCSIGSGSFFTAEGGELIVGDGTNFNVNVHINASIGGTISFGKNCLVGPDVLLRTANHKFNLPDVPIKLQGHSFADIIIEDDVWLGAKAIILSGVHIGKGSVIAAGAVVNRDVPPMAVVGGVPAKILKYRK